MKFESDYAKCYFFRAKYRAKKSKNFLFSAKINLDEVLKAQKGRAYFGMPGAQDRGIWYILGK